LRGVIAMAIWTAGVFASLYASENSFRRPITTLAGARVLGTLCAQAVLIPAALIIVRIAELI
jgi:hypothetical protein